jgi:ribosome biogenesis GTPase
MNSRLVQLGWTDARARQLAAIDPSGTLAPGRVALEHNHVYRVLTDEGERLAEAAGRIRYQATGRHELPAVGDWVALRPGRHGERSVIRRILPRQSWFSRKSAGRETTEQVVAANIDVVLIAFGLDKGVNPRAIERYLVVATRSQARPVIVLNKADLVADDLPELLALASGAAGATPVHVVSGRTGTGFDALEPYLQPGSTLALLGPSGAGKSTIVNRLVGAEVLPTGEVRAWDARGRHTSVHRQLVVREAGGVIIDTPGMRELQLWEPSGAVAETFTDIAGLGAGCKFRDCRHDREPGCAVKAAAQAGQLDPERYASYLKLQSEQEEIDRRRQERDLYEGKRRSRKQ